MKINEGELVDFNVLYIDIDGIKFLDKKDENNPYYEFYGNEVEMINYQKNVKDGSILSLYISVNTTINNTEADCIVMKD